MPSLGPDDTALYRWAAEGRVDEAAASRSRRQSLRQQLAEETSMRGTLLDYGEAGHVITVTGIEGRRLSGRVQSVGADYVALVAEDEHLTLVALSTLMSITARTSVVAGNRLPDPSQTLREILFDWSADRPDVVLHHRGASEPVVGVLHSVGTDVVVLLESTRDKAATTIALAGVLSVVLS